MKFASKIRELRLVMRPLDRTMDEQRRVVVIPGKTVEFLAGQYVTDDPEVINFLLKHYQYGVSFAAVDDVEEWKRQHGIKDIQVTTGARGTMELGEDRPVISIEPGPIHILNKPEPKPLEEVIDERLNLLLAPLLAEIKRGHEGVEKPKKKFTCQICHDPFPSGIAVGKHKIEVHSEKNLNSEVK